MQKIVVEQIANYTGHLGSIFAMCVDAAQSSFYTSGDDGIVAKWKINEPSADAEGLLKSAVPIYSLTLAEDKGLLLLGLSDGTVHFYDLVERKIQHSFRKTEHTVYAVFHDEHYQNVYILYGNGFLSVWNFEQKDEIYFTKLSEAHLRCITIWENHVLIGSSDGKIYVLNRQTFSLLYDWKAHQNSVFSLSVLSENKILLSGSRDAHLNIWDLQDVFHLIEKIPAHLFTINSITVSADQRFFATGSRDKTIKIWDSRTYKLLKVIDLGRNQGHSHSVNQVKWLENGILLSCSDDKKIIKWQIKE